MVQVNFEVVGIDEITMRGEQLGIAMATCVETAAELLRQKVVGNSPQYMPQNPDVRPVEDRHEPGFYRKSWTPVTSTSPTTFFFENLAPYARDLEEGLYPESMVVARRRDGTPGRLIKTESGVFSKFPNHGTGGPVAGSIIQDEDLMQDIGEQVSRQIQDQLDWFLRGFRD